MKAENIEVTERLAHRCLFSLLRRYAGLYWTNPDTYDKLDAKGIETVRRDNCGPTARREWPIFYTSNLGKAKGGSFQKRGSL